MLRFIAIAALFCVAGAVHWRDCGSTSGSFDKLEISDCDLTEAPCIVTKGTDVSLEVHFTPSKTVNSVNAVAHGILGDVEIPFPIPNAETCLDPNSGVKCPAEAGVANSYHAIFPVLAKYPSISVKARWELKDENNDNIVCVEFPITVK